MICYNMFKVDDYSHFFYFLRDQNSQHFNEDLLGVNASAFSFVLCFKQLIAQAPPIMQ